MYFIYLAGSQPASQRRYSLGNKMHPIRQTRKKVKMHVKKIRTKRTASATIYVIAY